MKMRTGKMKELLSVMFKIGCIGFGGGTALIPVLEDEIVQERKLVDEALRSSGKRQFLSKNPPHTGRIRVLMQMYPNAKFIYMVRNPYTVYESTSNFIKNTIKTLQLQDISEAEIEEGILRTYADLYDKYEADKGLVPDGHLMEVRFEDFERDPVAMVGTVYDRLNLGDFSSVRGRMAEYVGEKKGFKKNRYDYDDKTRSAVEGHWSGALKRWGYEI